MEEAHSRRSGASTLSLAVLSLLLLLLVLVASDGLYNIDEFMILAITEAMHSRATLTFQNGYEQFGSTNLLLWFFVAGPHGMVSQYPDGSAVLGAALYGPLGIRGLILLNALAAVATLFTTRQLARQLFDSENIAVFAALLLALGTFWLEFAFGIWPHALSAMCVTSALLFAVKAMDADMRPAVKWALLSGLAVGAGLLLRMDSLLILPSIGLCVLLFARHVGPVLAAGVVGVLPGIVILALVNHYKFGSYNPFSYGKSGGSVDLASYVAMIGAITLAGLAVVFARRFQWDRMTRKSIAWVTLIAVATVLLVPALRGFAWTYAYGFWALVVDSSVIRDPRPGVIANVDGVLFFWGFVKKALGQSLPWLGVLLVLAMKPCRDQHKRAIAIALIVVGVWTLPFIAKAWHGGLGSNMRYFLPLLPLLCVMGAAAWYKLQAITDMTPRLAFLPGSAVGLLTITLWIWFGPSQLAGAQQILSTYLLLAACAACFLLAVYEGRRKTVARVAQLLVAAGFAAAAVFGLLDLSASQAQRKLMAANSQALSVIPAPSLLIGPPEMFTFQIGKPNGLIALPANRPSNLVDFTLIRSAINAGYGVYAPAEYSIAIANVDPHFISGPRYFRHPGGTMAEISLRNSRSGRSD